MATITNPWLRRIIHAIEQGQGRPVPEAVQRWLKDSAEKADYKATQVAAWIQNTKRLTFKLVEAKSDEGLKDTTSLFWIKLADLLKEGPARFTVNPAILEAAKGHSPEAYLKKSMRAVELLGEMAKQFTESERWYIEYLRHTECHIFQTGFDLKLAGSEEKGYDLVDKYKGKIPIDDIWNMINEEVVKYPTATKAARTYAPRVAPFLDELEEIALAGLEPS